MSRLAIIFAFSLWIVATIFGQHPGSNHRSRLIIRKLSTSILMPNWSFFAPDPGTYDDHLLFREVTTDSATAKTTCSDWDEIWYKPSVPLLSNFYSKRSRQAKGIMDIVGTLESVEGKTKGRRNPEVVAAGRQAIANYVAANSSSSENNLNDFDVLIVKTAGYETESEPVYYYKFKVRNNIAQL